MYGGGGMVNSKISRILVVDDIPETLELISNWLELHSFNTLQATSGPQALKLAAEELPDLILLDVMMPRMDGIETCRQLKANPQTASIPVILVTAKDPTDARADGMFAGAVDYIAKPVNLPDLVSKVEATLMADQGAPVDVQRLLEEVAHTTLMIMGSALVWLLAVDESGGNLVSRALVTSSGSLQENDFLSIIGKNRPAPQFVLDDMANPLCAALKSRKTTTNVAVRRLQENPSTQMLAEAMKQLHLTYMSVVPLIAMGRPVGVMVLGSYQPQEMETPRAQQMLTAFGSQAAIAVDYARLMGDLQEREEEQQSEQAFRQMIIDTMSDALIVIDAAGNVKYVNRRLLRMTGYPPEALEGQSVGILFHPDDRHEVMTGLLRENAATMKFDQRLITREGRVIPVLMSRSRSQSNQLDNQVIVLSDMTEQKDRESALERQTGRLMALNKAAQAIASNLSLHETLQNILNYATQVVEAQGASLFLVNREHSDELFVVAAVGYGAADLINLRVPSGEGVAGWVASQAKPALVADLKEDPRFYRVVDEQTGMDTRSMIAVPLIHAKEVIGVIEVVNKLNDGVFDMDDMRLLESMAGTAAVSIMNARFFDQSQRRVEELATLLNASEAASSTLEFGSVLERIVQNLTRSLDVSHCILMAWNAPQRRLETLAETVNVFWDWADQIGPYRPILPDTAVNQALANNQAIAVTLHQRDLHPADENHLTTLGMLNMLVIPLSLNGEVSGVSLLYNNNRKGAYTAQDAEKAQLLADRWRKNVTAKTLTEVSASMTDSLAQQFLGVGETCRVTIQEGTGDNARVVGEFGFAEWVEADGAWLELDHFPTMQNVITRKQYHLTTIEQLPTSSAEHEWLVYRGGHSCLMLPLVSHGEAIGMVILIDIVARRFDPQEVNLAQGIANVVSNAMENAQLFQSLQSRAKALESAYAELQEADRAKDEFMQNVSHELRTPLIHVLGYAELLADEAFGTINDEQREALQTIAQKAQKVADIVEDMVSAQAQETRQIDRQPIDLVGLVKRKIDTCNGQFEEAGLQVITHFPENIPPIPADPNMIAEALEKLLDNAIKFGRDGKRIEVMVRDTDGPFVQVAIRDYGIGIDPSEHQKIFQRFYQVDGGATRRYAGTGLGLAVARSIIESHSGRIGLKSRLNEGSIFYFNLPKHDYMHS